MLPLRFPIPYASERFLPAACHLPAGPEPRLGFCSERPWQLVARVHGFSEQRLQRRRLSRLPPRLHTLHPAFLALLIFVGSRINFTTYTERLCTHTAEGTVDVNPLSCFQTKVWLRSFPSCTCLLRKGTVHIDHACDTGCKNRRASPLRNGPVCVRGGRGHRLGNTAALTFLP